MSEYFWAIYKVFHDTPGTPKEIKCIGCKVAAGCTCLAASGLCLYGTKKHIKLHFFRGCTYGLAALAALSTSLIAFRMANDDYKYNQRLIATHKEYLSKTRLENKVNKNLGSQLVSGTSSQ